MYYIDWSDIRALVPTDLELHGSSAMPCRSHRAKGFELELQSRDLLAEGLSMSISCSYTDVQLESITNLGLKRRSRLPRSRACWMLASADYEIKSNAAWTAGINVSTSYTGSSASAFGPVGCRLRPARYAPTSCIASRSALLVDQPLGSLPVECLDGAPVRRQRFQ